MSDDRYRTSYEQAWNNANSVPGHSVTEQVEYALTRRVYSVESLAVVRRAVKDLAGEQKAVTFWKLAGLYLQGAAVDAEAKHAFVEQIKALEPKPAPPAVVVSSGPIADVSQTALSDHLHRSFGISKADVPA